MTDDQTQAAEVLAAHAGCRWDGSTNDPRMRPCGAPLPRPGVDVIAAHQAAMLATAGLLATAEHDRQVAAQALRETAAAYRRDDGVTIRDGQGDRCPLAPATWMDLRADRIEAGRVTDHG